jgi:MOB kinase activator 1
MSQHVCWLVRTPSLAPIIVLKLTMHSADYTWIDQNRNPMPLPAPTYVKHIQTWVGGKVLDTSLFPMDPFTSAPSIPSTAQAASDPNYWLGKPSGFPQRFETEIKNMYKQMFRCYAHLYWQHWLAFWDLNCYRELNTCFVHFINVARLYNLLSEKDMEPMQPLVDVWVKQGVLPKVEKPEAGVIGSALGQTTSNGTGSAPVSA